MTINYCDFTNGDDGTGDGTHGNPYKTITTASTSLTGGDEVRVAKSVDSTDLSGTLAFVNGSVSITTSVDLTGVLSAGDFVYKSSDSDNLVEVISLTSTILTLYKAYYGTTETVASKKLGVTDTGEAGVLDQVQVISASGTSTSSRLKISGGWTLSTQVQDGFSYFRQIHNTFNNRYGYGLYVASKNYLEIEDLGFLRYYDGNNYSSSNNNLISTICNGCHNRGIYGNNFNNNTLTSIICNNNTHGIYLENSDSNIFNNIICNTNSSYGIFWGGCLSNTINTSTCNNNNIGYYITSNSNFNTINNPTCKNNSTHGLFILGSTNNIIKSLNGEENENGFATNDGANNNMLISPICNNNVLGIYLYLSNNNIITSPTCNNNSNYGIRSYSSISNIINNYSGTGNTSGDVWVEDNVFYGEDPILNMQHFNTIGDNRCYYEFGATYRDTTDSMSGQCLKFAPTSDTYYIKHSFCFLATSSEEKNISFYIKDNVAFDGDVQAALYFMEKRITSWTTIPTTTSYVQHTLVGLVEDITENGVIKLHIKTRGTAGNIFVDGLGASE